MDTVRLIVLGGSWILSIAAYICYSVVKKQNIKLNSEIEELKYNLNYAQKENAALKETIKLSAKTEEKVNEKVEKLHTGDSVSNAINGLCKH